MANKKKTMDRISELPDDILCDILSFLPTHDSLKTSLLSTRFRYLWQSIPILDLTDKLCPSQTTFEKLMEKVLSSHEHLSRLRKFRLWCHCFCYSNITISKWIDSATASLFYLEELDIKVFDRPMNRVELPSTLFSCRRLKTLNLVGGIKLSNIPADACLPCLKTFNFISITISVAAYNLSHMVLSAVCPALENFLIKDCFLEILRNLTIKLPLGYLRGHLDSASLDLKVLKQLDLHDRNVDPFLASLTCCLVLYLGFADQHGNYPPIFPHLTHVVAKVHHLYPSSYMRVLLEQSPNLISLVLDKTEWSKEYSWGYPGQLATVSDRSLCKNLGTVQINDFNGFQDMGLVKYFLKNAEVLKNLVLCVARTVRLSNEFKASILHEIRALSQCEVEFRD